MAVATITTRKYVPLVQPQTGYLDRGCSRIENVQVFSKKEELYLRLIFRDENPVSVFERFVEWLDWGVMILGSYFDVSLFPITLHIPEIHDKSSVPGDPIVWRKMYEMHLPPEAQTMIFEGNPITSIHLRGAGKERIIIINSPPLELVELHA